MRPIRVRALRTVFNDGNHNAFTDLCRFRGRFYLAFRSCPDGHMVYPTSRIVILSSADAVRWEPAFTFSVPDRDVRDPHFLAFREQLFVYSGTWLCDLAEQSQRDVNKHLGYAVWSADGRTWHGPRYLEGTYGHYIWRAATYGGKAYLCGYRKRGFAREASQEAMESALLESEDGFIWRYVGLFRESYGSEVAFLFEDTGEFPGQIVAIARGHGDRPAQLCRSRPPYRDWTRLDLDRNIGGPLLAKWGDRYLVGGRKWDGPRGPVTALYWLVEDHLVEAAELPSGGDNSYPGFVALSDEDGLLSYYSSHEGSGSHLAPSAIYLAEITCRDR